MDEVFSNSLDLTDQPLTDPDIEYYTNGSSSIQGDRRLAGYAAVILHTIIEAKPLPQGTLAQKSELITLTQALQLAPGVRANSKYAFTTLHVHKALYKEKGLINLGGNQIKYGQEILDLLEAVWAPKKVAVIHCRGHQKGDTIAG